MMAKAIAAGNYGLITERARQFLNKAAEALTSSARVPQ
jgi:hypothetical protein